MFCNLNFFQGILYYSMKVISILQSAVFFKLIIKLDFINLPTVPDRSVMPNSDITFGNLQMSIIPEPDIPEEEE